jgi:uncharacterized protein YkwD
MPENTFKDLDRMRMAYAQQRLDALNVAASTAKGLADREAEYGAGVSQDRLDVVNRHRAKQGLPPLTLDEALEPQQ